MANEAEIIELLGNAGDPIRFTCADGTGIEKGSLLQLSSDPRTVTKTSADGETFVGVAAMEKVANDGSTEISVYTNGIFDIKDSGLGITVGEIVKVDGANLIATADEAGAQANAEVVGQAYETAANGEVIAVRILK